MSPKLRKKLERLRDDFERLQNNNIYLQQELTRLRGILTKQKAGEATMRDYFAAAIVGSLLQRHPDWNDPAQIAGNSFLLADAFLAERNKEGSK